MITAAQAGKPEQCELSVTGDRAEERMRTRVFHSGEQTADVEFCLVFPGEALSVPVMRRVLGDTLSRLGMDERCVGDILLAVTEACSNVVRHAGPERRYEVVAHVGSKRCLLEVVDSGRGVDSPASAPPPAPHSELSRARGPAAPPPGQPGLGTVVFGDAPQPDHQAAPAGQGARDLPVAGVRPGPRDHARVRGRRDHAEQAGPGNGGLAAEADRVAQRRAAGPQAGLTAQGRWLSR